MYNLSATRVEVTTENLYNEVAKPTKRRNSMASYKHLTIGQRERLYLARNKGESMAMIAAGLGVSKSTVSRELKRNGGLKDYSPPHLHRNLTGRGGQDAIRGASLMTWRCTAMCLRNSCAGSGRRRRLQAGSSTRAT